MILTGTSAGLSTRASLPVDVRKILPSPADVKRLICEETAQQCVRAFGSSLRAIILTGSLARNEATFETQENFWHLLGDADYFLVFSKGGHLPAAIEVHELGKQIESCLQEAGVVSHVGLNAIQPSYLEKLPAHISSFELRTCGQVVWGDSEILALIPKFSVSDLTREDAWHILCNRAIEHLAHVKELTRKPEPLSPALHYATVKLYLDMATSYLIFSGQYAPTYEERAKNLREIASRAELVSIAPLPLKQFADRVAECTEWKLKGDDADRDLSLAFWTEAIGYFRRLWRWETVQMAPNTESLAVGSLCDGLAQRQTMAQRVRGWASLAKRRGWIRGWRDWLRWSRFVYRGTPRYLVYRAATELVYRLPCLINHGGNPPRLDVNWNELRNDMPVRFPSEPDEHESSWQLLANEILKNYWQFLADTRA